MWCECILYFYGKICGIQVNIPRSLKNAFHIPEECHVGLASLSRLLREPFKMAPGSINTHQELLEPESVKGQLENFGSI